MISTLIFSFITQGSFPSINHKQLPANQSDFWFVALGDNRPAGAGIPPTQTFKDLLKEVAIIGPTFVLSSGDLLYGNEETVSEYKQEVEWIKPLINTLPCPFYNAPGNHEINNRPEFYSAYTKAFGQTYGSFEYGGFRFVAVCTEIPAPKPSIFGEQLDWLKKTLDGSKPTVVFQHHPVFVRKSNDEKETAHVDESAMIHDLYLKGGVKLVVEGHDHIYNAQVHDGIQYRIAGGAGAPLDGPSEDGGYFHFMLVHAHDGELEATPVPTSTLEVLAPKDGVAIVCDYANIDLPCHNVLVKSSFKPRSVTASYTTKKKKTVSVEAKIVETKRAGTSYLSQVELVAPRAHATTVVLGH